MALLGDKLSCRKMALQSKTPIFPGSKEAIEEEEEGVKLAAEIGYPVIVRQGGSRRRGTRHAHRPR